jgi:hypothetical protein
LGTSRTIKHPNARNEMKEGAVPIPPARFKTHVTYS